MDASTSPPTVACGKCRQEYPGDALFCPMCGTAKARDFDGDPLLGTVVGDRYLLTERIGHGASGTIYAAEHTTLRRKVAIKVLHDELSRDDLAIERFRRAATTVGEIDNDHIVAIHDFGRTADGRLYLAMELLEGETLHDRLEREGQLPIDLAVDIAGQLAEALMEAHAVGYVHRDLRPRNIFLARRRGCAHYVKILDFGLAKLVEKEGEAASTSLGMTFGDPRYMSPEQARGDRVDRRADIYSLGCILYEMVVGDPPFLAPKVFDVLTQHIERPPVAPIDRRPDCPPWLNAAILRALAKRPEDRFVTAYRFLQALQEGASTGRIMEGEVARRKETLPPPSVSATLARFGLERERAPSEPFVVESDREPEPDADDARTTTPIARGKSGAVRGPTSSGISQAWYADGEAMSEAVEDGASVSQIRQRLGGASLGASDAGLVSYEDEYEGRRRLVWLGGAAVAVAALGIAVAMALGRGAAAGDADAGSARAGAAAAVEPAAVRGGAADEAAGGATGAGPAADAAVAGGGGPDGDRASSGGARADGARRGGGA
ncbi:MAG: serine/threonine protein kinase, partial [Deltaproteobacteria bacterium]